MKLRPMRIVLTVLLTTLLAPFLSAEAQQPGKVTRIGFLIATSGSTETIRIQAFRGGLRELGYEKGKNIAIEWRYAEGNLDRLRDAAAELVRLKVKVIVTGGSISTRSAKEATTMIPIVMAQDPD